MAVIDRLVLRGDRVVLRAFDAGEAQSVLEHWLSSPYMVRTTRDRARMRRGLKRRIDRSGRLVDGWLDVAIEAEGDLVGEISARRPKGAMPPGVFELGIEIWSDSLRGRGYGSEAVELLTSHLFDAESAGRVQASTAVWNTAMRRVFGKLGFTEEGVMRGFMPTDDGRDDYVLYGVTRDEWIARNG
ncbi:MAG: GNAT family N-acetyltransferase [Actinomycetota bacterium]|nr:GNAT family N-acetyltransferase [Actinomycetota bacterium]